MRRGGWTTATWPAERALRDGARDERDGDEREEDVDGRRSEDIRPALEATGAGSIATRRGEIESLANGGTVRAWSPVAATAASVTAAVEVTATATAVVPA